VDHNVYLFGGLGSSVVINESDYYSQLLSDFKTVEKPYVVTGGAKSDLDKVQMKRCAIRINGAG